MTSEPPKELTESLGEPVREQDKIHLMLAYIGPLSLIPLLTVKDSEQVQWHAKQGLVFSLCVFLASVILAFIPVLGWLAGCFLTLSWVGVSVLAISKALKGERWRIPLAADIAEKF
jgi:uncharacterized membrane protein